MDKKYNERSGVLAQPFPTRLANAELPEEELKVAEDMPSCSDKKFQIPTVVVSLSQDSLSDFIWPELFDIFPDKELVEKSHSTKTRDKEKLILAGLSSEICINICAFSVIQESYEIYVAEDAQSSPRSSSFFHRQSKDFSVLSYDIFKINDDDIRDIHSLMSIYGGEIVHACDNFIQYHLDIKYQVPCAS